ncbi:hypothetical protein MKW92_003954 [Papaver armeniacum]|nr:hypothetical protein MKW92_003954 [Papaver armeniacum]
MTNSGNYKRNKKMRAKLMKEKAKLIMGLHSQRRCESSQSSGHDDHRQRPRSPQACSCGPVTPTATILVKGLPKETTEEMIHQILAEWRPLRNVRVMMKKNSSVCRGIAFIDFPSVVAARKMIDEIGDGGLDVNGRKLSFEYRLGEITELAGENPIVNNAGVTKKLPDSCVPEELRVLKVSLSFLCFFEFMKVEMNSFRLNVYKLRR